MWNGPQDTETLILTPQEEADLARQMAEATATATHQASESLDTLERRAAQAQRAAAKAQREADAAGDKLRLRQRQHELEVHQLHLQQVAANRQHILEQHFQAMTQSAKSSAETEANHQAHKRRLELEEDILQFQRQADQAKHILQTLNGRITQQEASEASASVHTQASGRTSSAADRHNERKDHDARTDERHYRDSRTLTRNEHDSSPERRLQPYPSERRPHHSMSHDDGDGRGRDHPRLDQSRSRDDLRARSPYNTRRTRDTSDNQANDRGRRERNTRDTEARSSSPYIPQTLSLEAFPDISRIRFRPNEQDTPEIQAATLTAAADTAETFQRHLQQLQDQTRTLQNTTNLTQHQERALRISRTTLVEVTMLWGQFTAQPHWITPSQLRAMAATIRGKRRHTQSPPPRTSHHNSDRDRDDQDEWNNSNRHYHARNDPNPQDSMANQARSQTRLNAAKENKQDKRRRHRGQDTTDSDTDHSANSYGDIPDSERRSTSTRRSSIARDTVQEEIDKALEQYDGHPTYKEHHAAFTKRFTLHGAFAKKPDTKTPPSEYVDLHTSTDSDADINMYLDNLARWAKLCLTSHEAWRQKIINGVQMSPTDKATCARYRADDRPGFSTKVLTGVEAAKALKDACLTLYVNMQPKYTNAASQLLALTMDGATFPHVLKFYTKAHAIYQRSRNEVTTHLLEHAIVEAAAKANEAIRNTLKLEIRFGKGILTDSELTLAPTRHTQILEAAIMACQDKLPKTSTIPRTTRTIPLHVNEQRLAAPEYEAHPSYHHMSTAEAELCLRMEEHRMEEMDQEMNHSQDRIHEAQLQVNHAHLGPPRDTTVTRLNVNYAQTGTPHGPPRTYPMQTHHRGYSQDTRQYPRTNTCPTCGIATHTFETCPWKCTGPGHQSSAPPSKIKFALNLTALRALPLDEARTIVNSSINNGVLKFHNQIYHRDILIALEQHAVDKARPRIDTTPATLVSAKCMVAMPPSATHHAQAQLPYSNQVLPHVQGQVRAATYEEINREILRQVPQDSPSGTVALNQADPEGSQPKLQSSLQIIFLDCGSTPTCADSEMIRTQGYPTTRSANPIYLVDVNGGTKPYDRLCWLTITFSESTAITVQAIVADNLTAPILLGMSDFLRHQIGLQAGSKVVTFGDYANPSHIEPIIAPNNTSHQHPTLEAITIPNPQGDRLEDKHARWQSNAAYTMDPTDTDHDFVADNARYTRTKRTPYKGQNPRTPTEDTFYIKHVNKAGKRIQAATRFRATVTYIPDPEPDQIQALSSNQAQILPNPTEAPDDEDTTHTTATSNTRAYTPPTFHSPTPKKLTILKDTKVHDLTTLTLEQLVEFVRLDTLSPDPPANIEITEEQETQLFNRMHQISQEDTEMAKYKCDPIELKKLQTAERQRFAAADALKDQPCLDALKHLCTEHGSSLDSQGIPCPKHFSPELWKYVFDTEKPKVQGRFDSYADKDMARHVAAVQKLKIDPSRPHCTPYYEAQAIANIDRFIIIDENNPPMIRENFTFSIDLKPGATPVKEKPQKFNELQKKFLTAKTTLLLLADKIGKRDKLDPLDWTSRLMLVPYKDRIQASRDKWGDNFMTEASKRENFTEVATWYRMTMDLRLLNAATIAEPYPMQSDGIAKENCSNRRFYCVSDIADAFFSVKLRDSDWGKTGFTTHDQQFVFKVMPQGAMNAARQFSRIAAQAFENVPLTVILPFQDDTLQHADTFLRSLQQQQLLYDKVRLANLILKISKTTLGYSSAKFLGHVYSVMGRTPDPALVSAVLDLAPPTDATQVKQLLGLVQYNIEYIRHGMEIISTLFELTKKGIDVQKAWDPITHGRALDQIKLALCSAPCLITIDQNAMFTIHVDTCKTARGIGAVLLQYVAAIDQWRPCAYYSRKLLPGQQQWSATELEAMGMVFAITHWDKFLKNGIRFRVIVDHMALIWLVTRKTKTANGRIITWILQLQEYDFEIMHRNGEQHVDADTISRLLHIGDLADTHTSAQDTDIDDLNGPASIGDLMHMKQLQRLREADSTPNCSAETHLLNLVTHSTECKARMMEDHAAEVRPPPDWSEAQQTLRTARVALTMREREQVTCAMNTIHPRNRTERSTARQATATSDTEAARIQQFSEAHQLLKEAKQRQKTLSQPQPPKTSSLHKELLQEEKDIKQDELDDALVEPFKYLEQQFFIDPTNRRLYQIVLICMDRTHQVIAAYRRAMDDEPPEITDHLLICVEGHNGAEALVHSFTQSGGNNAAETTTWPQSDQEMRLEQMKDPALADILRNYDSVKHTQYLIIDNDTAQPGSLRRLTTRNISRHLHPVCIPAHLIQQALQMYHEAFGHPGETRMIATMQLRMYWPGFRNDAELHCRSCMSCARRKASHHPPVPIQAYNGPDYPFQRCHMDLTGPFPPTQRNMTYILVVKCALTRYVETIALPDKAKGTVAAALISNVYLRHGSIATLISDKGAEFTNAVMRQLTLLLKTKRITTTPANPRANGLAENHMRGLKDQIAVHTNANHSDWDTWLISLSFAYNTTVNAQTGYSPFFMVYGREANTPSTEWIDIVAKAKSEDNYVTRLITQLQRMWFDVGERKQKEVETFNKVPLRKIQFKEHRTGDTCFIKNVPKRNYIEWASRSKHNLSCKLQMRYEGPYPIIKQHSPVLYTILKDGKERRVHAINMKSGITPRPASEEAQLLTRDNALLVFPSDTTPKRIVPTHLKAHLRHKRIPLIPEQPHTETIITDAQPAIVLPLTEFSKEDSTTKKAASKKSRKIRTKHPKNRLSRG